MKPVGNKILKERSRTKATTKEGLDPLEVPPYRQKMLLTSRKERITKMSLKLSNRMN